MKSTEYKTYISFVFDLTDIADVILKTIKDHECRY